MVRRSPAESYIKFLICHPDDYADDDIRGLVKMQQLDFIGMPNLHRLRSICVHPHPFYPEDRLHLPSVRFLREQQVEAMFRMDKPMRAALFILGDAMSKEVTETMLINRSHPEWICTALHRLGVLEPLQRQNNGVGLDAIALYKHYFFNVDLVDSSELKTLMSVRMVGEVSTDPDVQRLTTAHAALAKSDHRRNAAMSASPLAANIIDTLRMGLMPHDMDIARIANAVRTMALAGSLDMSARGLHTIGKDAALTAKLMTEVLEAIGDPANDLASDLAKLAIETDTDDVPHILELSEGSHTLDVSPITDDEVGSDVTSGSKRRGGK